MNKNFGFSLIELVIVIAIIAIIAAVAVPSYNSYMTKTRRVEATSFLTEVAGEQQRYFSENNSYAEKLTEIGYPNDEMLTENGYYSVSVTAFGTSTFTLTAARVANKAQAGDNDCGDFQLNSIGSKQVTGAAPADTCW